MPLAKHVEAFLTTVGLPAEDVTKMDSLSEEELKTFDFKPYEEKVRSNYRTQLQNDSSFFDDITLEKLPVEVKKRVENSQFGRAANITKDKLLKGLGMTEADYADLSAEQKDKLELLIPAIVDKWTKTKSGDKELQQQLIEARKKIEDFGLDYETKIATKYQTEAEGKITNAIFNANLISELSSIPGLKIAASDIAKTANDLIQNKYGFVKIGEYSVELRKKDNPAMKVLKDGTSHELTLKDALTEIATERGWIDKEEGGKGGGKIIIKPTNGKLEMVAPHVQDKISKKIAAEV